jgi:hypothetical protein
MNFQEQELKRQVLVLVEIIIVIQYKNTMEQVGQQEEIILFRQELLQEQELKLQLCLQVEIKFHKTAEEYNGTSWTAGGNLATGRGYLAGAGTQTTALAIGGKILQQEQQKNTMELLGQRVEI